MGTCAMSIHGIMPELKLFMMKISAGLLFAGGMLVPGDVEGL